MPHPEQRFHWTFELTAPPAALWPLVSNTDRFSRHNMHQQPPHAPRSPKSFSKSAQRSGVKAWKEYPGWVSTS